MRHRGSMGPPSRDGGPGARLVPIPKAGGGTRWLTRLDPAGEAGTAGRSARSPAGSSVRSGRRSSPSARGRPRRDGGSVPGVPRGAGGGRPCGRRRSRRPGAPCSRSPTSGTATDRSRRRSSSPSWARRRSPRSTSSAVSGTRASAACRSDPSRRRSSRTPSSGSSTARSARPASATSAGWTTSCCGGAVTTRCAVASLRFAAAAAGLELHDRKSRVLADRDELQRPRARRTRLLYHRGAVRTLYRASRVVTLSHPHLGEWVLVDGRHVERVGTGDPRRPTSRSSSPARRSSRGSSTATCT